MLKFLSIFNCVCFFWIYNLEIACSSQDDRELLLEVIETLLDDNELGDVKDIHSKKQMSNDVADVLIESRESRSYIGKIDRHYTGDVRGVGNDDMRKTEDVREDYNVILKDIDAFLSSKRARRKKQKKWLEHDGARGTPTTTTGATAAPETPPPKTTTTTTEKPRKCKVSWGWWGKTFHFYVPCR